MQILSLIDCMDPVSHAKSLKRTAKFLEAVKRRALEYEEQPLIKPFVNRISDPKPKWKVFKTLASALLSRSMEEDAQVFAFEPSQTSVYTGKRLFVTTSYDHFYHYYKQLPPEMRHYYEVIVNEPCKLYFDLEFATEINPLIDGYSLTSFFIQVVCFFLRKTCNIEATEKNVLVLHSANAEKFSQHLIFLLPGYCFQDNSVVGRFVKLVASYIEYAIQELENDEGSTEMNHSCLSIVNELVDKFGAGDLRRLKVAKTDCTSTWFFDLAVYSKNRNFRIFRSSKLGRTDEFLVSESNSYEIPSGNFSDNQNAFLASLVLNVEKDSVIINTDTFKMYEFIHSEIISQAKDSSLTSSNFVGTYSESPFPEVDAFIKTKIKDDNFVGHIRKWVYFQSNQIMVYEIGNFRYCENIKRHHKSNHILFVVDLKNKVYYQKCHDPDCRQSNPKYYPLPPNTFSWMEMSDIMEWDFE